MPHQQLKAYWNRAYRDYKRKKTTGNSGYHSANMTLGNLPECLDSIEAILHNLRDNPPTGTALAATNTHIRIGSVNLYYCWSHRYVHDRNHTSATCRNKKDGHKDDADHRNCQGGSTKIEKYNPNRHSGSNGE